MSHESLRLLVISEADECELAHKTTDITEKKFHFDLAEEYASLIVVLRQVNLTKTTHSCVIAS
jgi:hypothetical protein